MLLATPASLSTGDRPVRSVFCAAASAVAVRLGAAPFISTSGDCPVASSTIALVSGVTLAVPAACATE